MKKNKNFFNRLLKPFQKPSITSFFPNYYLPAWQSVLYDYACVFSFGLLVLVSKYYIGPKSKNLSAGEFKG